MKPSHRATLEAFLVALAKLSSPLPEPEQKQLQEIGSDLSNRIQELDNLADSYPSMMEEYAKAYGVILKSQGRRNKGGKPEVNETRENLSPERDNISLSTNTEKIDFSLDDEQLMTIATQVLTSPEPVKAAQNSIEIQYIQQSLISVI